MTKSTLLTTAAAALLLLAGCADRGRAAARQLARRNSCIAAELALDAKERLASLDTAVATAQGTPLEQVTVAGHAFAAAYRQWADASSRSADLADSAAFARSREDSVRLIRQSDEARPLPVAHGTVESNAAASFNQDFARAFGNPDHPCNQPRVKDGD
ncbi:MAG TPA: hypothetical protein VGO40_00745 [Longimicrobium sp.]|jgi:hypothetical protein|nr:hypothetical protein [Longimicrobium sp.]